MADENTSNLFTDDEIKTLEGEHRRIARVPHEDGEFEYVVKPGDKLQWKLFRKSINNEDERPDAQETFVMQTVVAVAYAGKRAFGKDDARKLLTELLKDWVAAADDKKVTDVLVRLNSGVGVQRAKM